MVNQINNLNTKQRRIIRVKKILLLRANKENILSRSTFSPFNSYSSCSRTSTKIFSSKNLDNYINLQDFLNKIHQTNLEFNENNENIEIKLTRQERNRLSAKANRDKKNNDLECLTGKVQQLQNQNEFLQTLLSKYPPHLVAQVESRLRAKHELEIRDNSLQQQSFFPDHE